MTAASRPTHRPSIRHVETIDGVTVPVSISGQEEGRTVIMFDRGARATSAYNLVRDRLHVAMFRTVVVYPHDELTPKAAFSVLDRVKVAGGLLVGDGTDGELAWGLAAAYGARFTGLVAIDCGHPSVPGVDGDVRDTQCPAVEVDTTVLVSCPAAHAVATASRRMVQGEFRLVDLAGPRTSRHFAAQLATEIVVRALAR